VLTGVLNGPPEYARDRVYLRLRVEDGFAESVLLIGLAKRSFVRSICGMARGFVSRRDSRAQMIIKIRVCRRYRSFWNVRVTRRWASSSMPVRSCGWTTHRFFHR
jgi:hypothetical protein